MHSLTVYMKERLPFAQDLSLENSTDSYLCFRLVYFTALLLFPLSITFFSFVHGFYFILFHLAQMRFFRSTCLLMCLSLETSTSIIRTGLSILVELIDMVNCYNFCQTTLLRWLTFLIKCQTVIVTVLFFWIYFFLLTLVFVLRWLCLHWESLIVLLSQFPLTFHHIHDEMPRFIEYLMTILVLIATVFMII